MMLYLTGEVSIGELRFILSEIASFCGEDSMVTLADTPIALDVASFVESPDEQEDIIKVMLDTLAKYSVKASAGAGR